MSEYYDGVIGIRYGCATCGHESAELADLACGHWSTCPHYARRRAAGVLPPISERPASPGRPYD